MYWVLLISFFPITIYVGCVRKLHNHTLPKVAISWGNWVPHEIFGHPHILAVMSSLTGGRTCRAWPPIPAGSAQKLKVAVEDCQSMTFLKGRFLFGFATLIQIICICEKIIVDLDSLMVNVDAHVDKISRYQIHGTSSKPFPYRWWWYLALLLIFPIWFPM